MGYRRGDLGYIKDDKLFIVGREGDILTIAGNPMYPLEIESVVMREFHKQIDECCAFNINDQHLGDIICLALSFTKRSTDKNMMINKIINFFNKHSCKQEKSKKYYIYEEKENAVAYKDMALFKQYSVIDMKPKKYFVFDSFPAISRGKVNRKEILRQIKAREVDEVCNIQYERRRSAQIR